MHRQNHQNSILALIEKLKPYQDLLQNLVSGTLSFEDAKGLGLPRSARLPILAALHRDTNKPVLLLTNRVDRAMSLFDELPFWTTDVERLFFSEPSTLFYEQRPWSESTRLERLAVLASLSRYHLTLHNTSPCAPIIIAPIRAVMTRTLPRREFLRNTSTLKINQTILPDILIQSWLNIGYENSNIVVQIGQFSRRGGVLDIWPPGTNLPVRIEFFGNQIDTLRNFDPSTQRTVQQIDQIQIFPAREFLPVNAHEQDIINLTRGEFHIPEIYKNQSSLMDFLPDETIIFLDGVEFISAAVNDIEEEAINRRNEEIKLGNLSEDFPSPYITWSEITDSFYKKKIIELGYSQINNEKLLAERFNPGPRFAGRLKDLVNHLVSLTKKKQSWNIVSRQASRLKELWQDTRVIYDFPDQEHQFIENSLSSGWILQLEENFSHELLTDSEVFGWGRPQPRRRVVTSVESPETIYGDLEIGDYVVHIDHGIGKFTGLKKSFLNNVEREYFCIEYKDNDQLFVPIHQADRITRYLGPGGETPHLNRLGGPDWNHTKSKVRHAVQDVALELLDLYAKRKVAEGYAFSADSEWQKELEASFPYIETEDQLTAIAEVKKDMEAKRPMDRLLCGDVGYGKTEVTLRAAFKAVMDGKQVAVLVPTTVLAQQHYDTFRERLSLFPVEVEMLSRFRKPKEQAEILKKLADNHIDIIIGTHRLISSDVVFSDLGLVIIDEEQRFGVTHKEHLKKLRASVDVLTLTATPIPRTLYMALTGVRDISTINTPPEERLSIVTHIGPYERRIVREAIIRELDRGGQAFFVHNRVQTIPAMYNHLSNLVPEASIGIAHGQMPENELADVMHAFTNGHIDVLLCTSIIESGLDIPNANTLIVDRADTFGLAQLYQLRGRVGRGAQRAYAYLFRHNRRPPTPEGQERLETLAENTQLGSGYAIAMRDLEMRGAGELLGTRQSGYIASVGFHLYTKLLAQSVRQLRLLNKEITENEVMAISEIPSLPINIDLPLSMEIPPSYIPDLELRLKLYQRISNIRTEEEIVTTAIEFEDRFGPLPDSVENLLIQMKVKIRASRIGITSIGLENGQITMKFPPLPQGIDYRPLPQIDNRVRIGKNAYRINLDLIKEIPWQTFLLETLYKMEKAFTP